MAKDEKNRNDALLKICNETRYGTVKRVAIDLRHEMLDPKEWRMEPIGIVFSPSRPFRTEGQPFLWFPWFGRFQEKDVGGAINRELQFLQEKDPLHPARSVENLRRSYTPDAIINAGEKIEIDRVDIKGEISGLHHQHDVQTRHAYIKIVKPSEAPLSLKDPVIFTGASIMRTGGYAKTVEKITRRLCAHFGVASLHDPRVNEIANRGALADAKAAQRHGVDDADAEAALLHAAILSRTDLEALLRQYARRTVDRRDRMKVKARIRYMLDEACLVGYRWARAEADLHMKPIAERALRSRAGANKGGLASSASRRQKAERTWKQRALQLAKEIRGKNPSLSVARLVARMREHADELPGQDTLETYVSKLIQLGELNPRRK